jgi:transposase-like protein
MTIKTVSRRRFTAQQKAEAVALYLSEGLSCTAVAKRLGLPNSSLAKWVRQARIDRGDFGPPEQGQLTSDERAELAQLRRENRELSREKDFFQAGGSALCQGAAAAERFRLISQLSDRFSLAWLCRQLGVARSGFYAWLQRQLNPGPRSLENADLMVEVQAVFEQHRGFYGAPRIHQDLQATGLKLGRHRVARLMRKAALKAKTHRGFRPCRICGRKASDMADNLLQQKFSPACPVSTT